MHAARICSCGSPIVITDRIKEFGLKHGKDLSVWPAKCLACIIDATIGLFDSVEKTLPACARCQAPLGKHYYQDVPGFGDLCVPCWSSR